MPILPRLFWIAFLTLTLSGCGSAGDGPTDTGSSDTNPTCTEGQARVEGVCVDINECDEASHNCAENAVCTNTDGGFTCVCESGYEGDGVSCIDVDECTSGTAECPTGAQCTNTEGTFGCACPIGHELNGDACVLWYADHYAQLTEGVSSVDTGTSQASMIVVHGDRAFPVVLDAKHRTFIAAGELIEGRIAVFGHGALLKPGLLDDTNDNSGRLVRNAVRWVGQSANPVVGLGPNMGGLGADLEADGLTTIPSTPADLAEVDVFCIPANAGYSDDEIVMIQQFVFQGGGLIAGGQAWWWSNTHENAPANYPGNWLTNPAGITWTSLGNVEGGNIDVPPEAPSPLLHGRLALDALVAHTEESAPLTPEEQALAAGTVGDAMAGLRAGFPDDFTTYLDAAIALAAALGPVVPTGSDPVVLADEVLDTLAVRIDTIVALVRYASDVQAHPAGDDFPGAVPADAETVTRTISLTANYDGPSLQYFAANAGSALWVSTGLYAAPGAPITVTIPDSAVGGDLRVLIGAHKDKLWQKEEWRRYPEITRVYPLNAQQTMAANAFGGLVYIQVPRGTSMGTVQVIIQGGVLAPRFIHGQTTNQQWIGGIRDYPAPWGELQHDSVVITLPSTVLRALDDPETMVAFWESVADTAADLAAFSQNRPRRERFVLDRQISAGWMHSGYPLMGHLESAETFVDETVITEYCCWGMFHEFGHNHQWAGWLIPGTTETTVNLWSVYLNEKLKGIPSWETHEAITLEKRAERMQSYMDAGANFADWSVWTALESYLQIQEAFGWVAYQEVFKEYRGLSAGQAPSTEQAVINQWVMRLSKTVNFNLGPFYVTWGLPVNQATLDSIADLPEWEDNPMKAYEAPQTP